MKRLEVTVPKKQSKKVQDVLKEYAGDLVSEKVEKEGKAFTQFHMTMDSGDIDEITETLKDMKNLEAGDLTIDILEQKAMIEKGKRREGGSSSLSVQEMYSKAFEFSAFDISSWALIGLASGIAVFGALMDNIMVVIGAMVIAPMLGPFIALSFGLVVGDRRLIQDSIFYGVLSLFFSIAVAFIIAFVMFLLIPQDITDTIHLIADPGFTTVPLSLLVGAAAALTFTTELREALAGVAVAIALVPPAAVAGISLAMMDLSLFFDVSLVILTNVTALILAGSVTFKLMGIAPSTYYRKKISEEKLRKVLTISVAVIIVMGGVVGYMSYQDLQTANLRASTDKVISDVMGDNVIYQEVTVTRQHVAVEVAVVNPTHTAQQLEDKLRQHTNRDVTVKLISVNGTVE